MRLAILSLLAFAAVFSGSVSAQTNLALTATGATSGGGSGTYGPAEMNNNVITAGVYCWISTSGYPNTAWASYTWSSAVTVASITMHPDGTTTRYLQRATIQYWNGSAWVDDSTYLISTAVTPYTVNLASNRTTTAIRLYSMDVVGSQNSNPTIKEWQVYGPAGPTLSVGAAAGTATSVYADSTGTGGNGIPATSFTITNNATGASTLNSITLTAAGSGNDLTAYTQVALYDDSNLNSTFEFGTDPLYGTASTAFPSDNGAIVFTLTQAFAVSQMRRYFVVVKLNGSTLPNSGSTFNFQVSDIAVAATGYKAGVPSTTMNGLTIQSPSFTFTDNTSATQLTGYASSGNYVMQDFTVAYPAGPANSLASITLTAQGSGNDATGYASVSLYFDTDSSGAYTIGTDTQVATASAFAADNGTVTLTLSGSNTFTAAGPSRRFFVVVAFNATPTSTQVFQTRITAIAGGYTTTTGTNIPSPTAGFAAGVIMGSLTFVFADASPATQGTAYVASGDNLIQAFTLNYPSGPANTPSQA